MLLLYLILTARSPWIIFSCPLLMTVAKSQQRHQTGQKILIIHFSDGQTVHLFFKSSTSAIHISNTQISWKCVPWPASCLYERWVNCKWKYMPAQKMYCIFLFVVLFCYFCLYSNQPKKISLILLFLVILLFLFVLKMQKTCFYLLFFKWVLFVF